MGLIIDTGVFIKAEREARNDLARLYPAGEDVGLCTITVSELYEGVHLANNAERAASRREFIEQFAFALPVFDFTMNAALLHARLRAAQRKKGKMIGAHDLIIAATAMSLGWDVLTLDGTEFRQVEGLGVREA
ncbi:MAG: PIN domain-containing protein [Rhizobiales bacterium]|nr:PIN domain-containing protein [Hyphomicrobiales bacterium]MBI3672054.1 PIN domain-containing protein [Hyphomicrobiales bacterium]